jgi:hypothetical protein
MASLLALSLFGATAISDPREADSDVKGSISDVSARTKSVFQAAGITQTGGSSESSGKEQTVEGTKGELKVDVQLQEDGVNQTHVTIFAKEGTLKWNKDYAQNLLNKIIQQG